EQPLEVVAVVRAESTRQRFRIEVPRSPLESTIDEVHAAQRSCVERAKPQQCDDMLASTPVDEQVVPSNEVTSDVTHAPAGAEGTPLPLVAREFTKPAPDVAALVTHQPAARKAIPM